MPTTRFNPTANRVYIHPEKQDEQTEGGIIIPIQYRKYLSMGTVFKVSEEQITNNCTKHIQEGVRVAYLNSDTYMKQYEDVEDNFIIANIYSIEMMEIKTKQGYKWVPMENRVIVKPEKEPAETEGGIKKPEHMRQYRPMGEIVETCKSTTQFPKFKGVEKGRRVLFNEVGDVSRYVIDGEEYRIIKQYNLNGVEQPKENGDSTDKKGKGSQ